jgi:hypothetical protein
MRAFISSALFLVVYACGLAGCGDDEDEGRPRYRSDVNVSSDTNVADLDDDDRRQVCASLNGFVDTQVDFGIVSYAACLPGAILFSGNQDDCEAELARCMDSFIDPIQVSARFNDESVCLAGLATCDDITVADLEGCVNLNLGFAYDILDRLSCGGLSDAERNDAQLVMDTVSVCTDVNAACDDFSNVAVY